MIALLFAQAAVPAPAATPLADEDVVVIARKLNGWRGMIRTDPFGTRCVTRQSTGDAEIDAIGCTAMTQCWPDTLPRMRAAHARGIDKADRPRLEEAAIRDFGDCARPKRAALVEALHARRRAAAGGGS